MRGARRWHIRCCTILENIRLYLYIVNIYILYFVLCNQLRMTKANHIKYAKCTIHIVHHKWPLCLFLFFVFFIYWCVPYTKVLPPFIYIYVYNVHMQNIRIYFVKTLKTVIDNEGLSVTIILWYVMNWYWLLNYSIFFFAANHIFKTVYNQLELRMYFLQHGIWLRQSLKIHKFLLFFCSKLLLEKQELFDKYRINQFILIKMRNDVCLWINCGNKPNHIKCFTLHPIIREITSKPHNGHRLISSPNQKEWNNFVPYQTCSRSEILNWFWKCIFWKKKLLKNKKNLSAMLH